MRDASHHLSSLPRSPTPSLDFGLAVLALPTAATDRFSGAALAAVCREATRQALARQLAPKRREGAGDDDGDGGGGGGDDDDDDDEEEEGFEEEDVATARDEWASTEVAVEQVKISQADLLHAVRLVRRSQVPSAEAHSSLLQSYARFQTHGAD